MKRLIAIQQALHCKKDNKGHNYVYRSAEDILEVLKPLLADQHCAVICRTRLEGDICICTAQLIGEDGQLIYGTDAYAKEPERMNNMVTQQVSGASQTYCKRYALQNLFAIDDTERDVDTIVSNEQNRVDLLIKAILDTADANELKKISTTKEALQLREQYPSINGAIKEKLLKLNK